MVIEWNARFGDPETQVVLARLEEDLLPWLYGAACGRLPEGKLAFDDGAAVCVVLAAAGYPGTPRGGDLIVGLDDLAGNRGDGSPTSHTQVFHAGTRATASGIVTAGGRVLGVTARGETFAVARERAYAVIGQGPGQVGFEGMHFRRDIGLRGAS
jgi:phosphoribosylamine--glycine ligase